MLPKSRVPTHPGKILKLDFLDPANISMLAFARAAGITFNRLQMIVDGRGRISPVEAIKFADVLGTSKEIWLNLQSNYDVGKRRQMGRKKKNGKKQ